MKTAVLRWMLPWCLLLCVGCTGTASVSGVQLSEDTAVGGPEKVETADQLTIIAMASALQEMYQAVELYQVVLRRHGPIRPFEQVVRSKKNHLSALIRLFEEIGLSVPENPWLGHVLAPATERDACVQAMILEATTIALLEKEVLPVIHEPRIHEVISAALQASKDHHLPAFQRCVDRRDDEVE